MSVCEKERENLVGAINRVVRDCRGWRSRLYSRMIEFEELLPLSDTPDGDRSYELARFAEELLDKLRED